MMELKRMDRGSIAFVHECLAELRGGLRVPLDAFERYVAAAGLLDHPDFRVLVGHEDGKPIGLLTCNRFAMPRYLGYGYELEEVVVHPSVQGRGHGTRLVEAFLEEAARDPDVRRVLVKTDDEVRAGRLYQKLFDVLDTRVYARGMNRYDRDHPPA